MAARTVGFDGQNGDVISENCLPSFPLLLKSTWNVMGATGNAVNCYTGRLESNRRIDRQAEDAQGLLPTLTLRQRR